MRASAAVLLCLALHPEAAGAWPWPWSNHTTTPAPSAVGAFESGVAAALGFDSISSCFADTKSSLNNLWEAAEDYKRGGFVSKAKALVKFGEGIHAITEALEPCAQVMTDASAYKKLMADLADPRYYTVHNAITLCLNMAEDRKQLGAFAAAWEKGDFRSAGEEVTKTMLDVLGHPGIPSSNGTEAAQIALGLSEGLKASVDIKCFVDVSVEVPALIGGVLDIVGKVRMVSGLESLAHGLTGLVPSFKACLADRKQIMDLLREAGDFLHPAELAEKLAENVKDHGLDISIESASAIMAYKGGEWEHFGKELGEILAKVFIIDSVASIVV